MRNLDTIGQSHGTDKSSKHHDFLRFYERRLAHLRNEAFVMFEVGVYRGGSVATWSEYFPRATIVGLDITEDCRRFERDNIKIRIGDASAPDFLFDVMHEFGKPLVVLDDGSHRWDHQIRTLNLLFPVIPPGGVYIVEDLDTSFEAHLKNAPFQGLSKISCFDYLSALARRVVADSAVGSEAAPDLFTLEMSSRIASVEFGRRTAIISKKLKAGTGPE